MEGSTSIRSSGADTILSNYTLGKTLGIGSFSKVKIAEHVLTGHKVAIKIMNRRKIKKMKMEEKVRREMKILRLFMHPFKHPHIIRLYEVIETHRDIFVVMEYMQSGELFDYIVVKGRLQEDEARRLFQQVISGKPYAGPEVDVWSCGAVLYTMLCGTFPFDDENIPNLFNKIKGGIYTLPSHLSAGARDLIPRMLVVDPMKRVTIPEIHQHPWFQAHLPHYLAVPPPDSTQQADKINKEILLEVIKMGFDMNHLFEALHNRIQNEATVAYYLLLDNQSCASNGYLGADFQETMESGIASMISPAASMMAHQRQYIDQQEMGLGSHFPVKWDLGLKSWADPCEIMAEVLKVLQELNVFWKQIGHYGLKCRWFPGFTNHPESLVNEHLPADLSFGHNSAILNEEYDVVMSPNTVKFEVQLYKTESEKYLLDLQRVKGPQLLFLDLCAAFRAQLRVL